jgi:hypothetical protein
MEAQENQSNCLFAFQIVGMGSLYKCMNSFYFNSPSALDSLCFLLVSIGICNDNIDRMSDIEETLVRPLLAGSGPSRPEFI